VQSGSSSEPGAIGVGSGKAPLSPVAVSGTTATNQSPKGSPLSVAQQVPSKLVGHSNPPGPEPGCRTGTGHVTAPASVTANSATAAITTVKIRNFELFLSIFFLLYLLTLNVNVPHHLTNPLHHKHHNLLRFNIQSGLRLITHDTQPLFAQGMAVSSLE
jgi:hypothetical protein